MYDSGRIFFYFLINFFDVDNNWIVVEYDNVNKDNVVFDVYWGVVMIYDYWFIIYGRNSFNGFGVEIRSFVYYDDVVGNLGYNNVFWNGSVMIYGDGFCGYIEGCFGFDVFIFIDVVVYEIGYVVIIYILNLVY